MRCIIAMVHVDVWRVVYNVTRADICTSYHTLYHCNDHCTSYRHWLHFSMTFNVFGNIHCATRHCNDHCNIRVVYVIKYWSIFVVLMRVWYEYRTKTRQKYQYSSFFIIFRVMRKKRCIIKTKTDETNGHKSIIS